VNLYFISRLGVDERVFQKLKLSPNFTIHYLRWIKPLKNESITSYANRLSAAVDQSKPFALIGLSFGGILASEMNQFLQPVKTIIISSAANYTEVPWYIRGIRFIPLYKLMPGSLLSRPNRIFFCVMVITIEEEKMLMKKLLADTNVELLKWSIQVITKWKNKAKVKNLIHIHGDADKLLPTKFTKTDYIIKGGEHLMIYSRAEEISELLDSLLTQSQL